MMDNLLAFFVFVSALAAASATSCYPAHPQTAVCNAHYVIRGRYMGVVEPETHDTPENGAPELRERPPVRPKISSHSYYSTRFAPQVMRVRLEKVYKGILVVNTSIGEDVLITSASMENLSFLKERLYVFTGYEVDGKLYTSGCLWNPLWEDVTLAQRFGLKRYYWMYCQCQIRFCPDSSCAPSRRVCNWDVPSLQIGTDKKDCHSKYNVCVAKGDQCMWFSPKGDVICQEDLLP